MYNFRLDKNEIIKRLLKYIIISLVIAIASINIPKNKLDLEEVVMISICGACVYAITDMYAPSVSNKTTINMNKRKL
jgi:hypothetical protein